MKLKVILCFVFILMMNSVFAQEKVSKKEKKRVQYKETLNLINSGEFIFEANKALEHGGRTISLTSNPNFLIISEENVEADLPFFYLKLSSSEFEVHNNYTILQHNPPTYSYLEIHLMTQYFRSHQYMNHK